VIFLSRVFKRIPEDTYRTMMTPRSDASLQVLFGKAFLLELERGDIETAKLFARAFLVRTSVEPKRMITVSAAS
jgi:hypothetical protein